LQANMFKSLGAAAVPVPWPETYTSLQTGVVDGQTNAAFVVEVFKIYEVQKYLSLTNSQFGYQIWLCNKAWYDSLSDADKGLIRDAIQAGKISTRGMALLREQESIGQLRKEGMKINSLTVGEIESLQAAAQGPGIEWLKTQMDPVWVDEMMAAIAEAEKKLGY
jgi:TRAP-type transport system periplasmic protein